MFSWQPLFDTWQYSREAFLKISSLASNAEQMSVSIENVNDFDVDLSNLKLTGISSWAEIVDYQYKYVLMCLLPKDNLQGTMSIPLVLLFWVMDVKA